MATKVQLAVIATAMACMVTPGCDCGGGDETGFDAGHYPDGAPIGPSQHVITCSGCPCFPGTDCSGSGTHPPPPPACAAPGAAPELVYPPDGALFPPNTNVIEVQFRPGAGNELFEIDFQNELTDVRVITRCNPIANTRGIATGGCGFSLSDENWRFVTEVNRGGLPVHVTVRATPMDLSCVGTSNSRDILVATEDVPGVIYYWQAATVDGVPGKSGGIFRFDFGRTDVPPEPFLESSPTTANRCYGCHFLSRDGERISYGSDDPDSDDEYGDVSSYLMDVGTRTLASGRLQPGFRTFQMDHSTLLASDGLSRENPAAFYRYDGTTGALVDNPSSGEARGTHPDWAPDDSRVVFVRPTTFYQRTSASEDPDGDDHHFSGGSLYQMTFDGTTFGAPTPLLMSSGENNYYPAFTPDGAFLIFDRILGATGIDQDAFSNPRARIWAMTSTGGAPVDLSRLNDRDGLSNSWPRVSPYVQSDRGHEIVWVTFSSIRDYGLRVQNEDPAGVACYPPESPQNPSTDRGCPLVPTSCACTTEGCTTFCVQPQIWMAAVEVDASGGINAGNDTSYPAFWLPFQEVSAHNHTAQWATAIPDRPPAMDGGTCGGAGAACGAGLAVCCAAYYCDSPTSGTCRVLM